MLWYGPDIFLNLPALKTLTEKIIKFVLKSIVYECFQFEFLHTIC